MKKTYITPCLRTMDILPAGLLCSSPLGNEDMDSSGEIIDWIITGALMNPGL